jgi:hypothetical protein
MPKLAVCGGVYANPSALSAMCEDAVQRGCERILCLGDLVGFGAECDAVWPLLLEYGITCIAGNYDIAIGRGDTDCGCGYRDPRDNEFAQVVYDYTRGHTNPEFAAFMRAPPLEHRERARARQALEEAGIEVGEERQVILRSMKVVGQPRSWGRFARRLTDAGVAIEFHYLATNTRIVVGVDDYQRAIAAIQVLGG